MNESIENESMKNIPMRTIPKNKTKGEVKERKIAPNYIWNRFYGHSRSSAENPLKQAIKDFLLKWLHPSTTLEKAREIGSKLYTDALNTYPNIEEEDDEDEDDEE